MDKHVKLLNEPFSVDVSEIWKIKMEFELPDSTRWKGESPSVAMILEVYSKDDPIPTVLAAPVIPDITFATQWDLVFNENDKKRICRTCSNRRKVGSRF